MPLTHTLMDWPSSKSNFETFVKSPFNFSFSDNATVLLDFIPMMNFFFITLLIYSKFSFDPNQLSAKTHSKRTLLLYDWLKRLRKCSFFVIEDFLLTFFVSISE